MTFDACPSLSQVHKCSIGPFAPIYHSSPSSSRRISKMALKLQPSSPAVAANGLAEPVALKMSSVYRQLLAARHRWLSGRRRRHHHRLVRTTHRVRAHPTRARRELAVHRVWTSRHLHLYALHLPLGYCWTRYACLDEFLGCCAAACV